MSLRDRSTERRLWKRIKSEIRKSKTLRREYRAARRTGRRNVILNGLGVLVFPLIAFSFLSKLSLNLDAQLLFASVFSLLVTLWTAGGFTRNLFYSTDAAVLAHYPISDEAFVLIQIRRLIGSGSITAVIAAGLFVMEGVKHPLTAAQWSLAAFLCITYWMLASCLAAIMVWFRPFAPWGRISFAISAALLISLFTINGFPEQTTNFWRIVEVWPGYWINNAFSTGIIEKNHAAFMPALGLLLLVPVAQWCLKIISSRFETGSHLMDIALTAEQYRDLTEPDANEPAPENAPHLAAGMLQPIDHGRAGWIENLINRMLSEREKVLSEFLTASTSFWTSHWKLSMLLACTGLTGPLIGPYFTPAWFLLILTLIGAGRGLPIGGGIWDGLSILSLGSINQAPVSQYPLGYWETTRLMIKVNMVRIAARIPAFILIPAVICWRVQVPVLTGMRLSAVAFFALAGFQVFVVGFKMFDLSGARNMKPAISLLGVPVMIFGLINGVSCLAAMAMAPWWGVLIAMPAYILPGLVLWAWFGFLFNHPKTDLFFPVHQIGQ